MNRIHRLSTFTLAIGLVTFALAVAWSLPTADDTAPVAATVAAAGAGQG